MPVVWFDIENPNPTNASNSSPDRVFTQGFTPGGASFNRLEGCWYDGGSIFFVSTSAGDAKNGDVNGDGFAEGYGQIWELTVTPRGGLLLCEDDASSLDEPNDTHPLAPGITNVNRVIGVTARGKAFEFAVNRLNDSEFAGACFSPSGETLFVNVFGDGTAGSGMTAAITGPWRDGPL